MKECSKFADETLSGILACFRQSFGLTRLFEVSLREAFREAQQYQKLEKINEYNY
jgi:hypothetical protein